VKVTEPVERNVSGLIRVTQDHLRLNVPLLKLLISSDLCVAIALY
jgi:hypothetical protein